MKCPHCGKSINIGKLIGGVTSEAKAEAARVNGRLGGRRRVAVKEDRVMTALEYKEQLEAAKIKPASMAVVSSKEQMERAAILKENEERRVKRLVAYV